MQNNQNNYFNGTYYQPPNSNQYQTNYVNQDLTRLKRKNEIKELITSGFVIGTMIVVYLLVQSFAVILLEPLGLEEIYNSSSLFQNCFSIIFVHLLSVTMPFGLIALILKKQYVTPVIPAKKVGLKKSLLWIAAGMFCCTLANYITSVVITIFNSFGYELTQGESLDVDSPLACLALVFSTAIVPAVCEEFAMRCCTLGALRKYGKGFAVFAVSVVFGLLHGNIIQFVFAFFVGLVLGYVTVRTDNVVIAMCIHGLNNGISVFNNILEYAFNDTVSKNITALIYYGWAIIGIICLVVLAVKNELLIPKQDRTPKQPHSLSFITKLLCLLPGFFIPFVLLIYMSVLTITPRS
jgi:membrane protease YdiL (CAAX protease family)